MERVPCREIPVLMYISIETEEERGTEPHVNSS